MLQSLCTRSTVKLVLLIHSCMQSFLSNFLRRIVLYLWFAFIFSVITSSLFPHYITLNIYNYYIYTYLKTQLLLTLQKLNSLWQERRKVDNWGGGGLIFIYSCSASFISFESDCFYSLHLNTNIWISAPPLIIDFPPPLA